MPEDRTSLEEVERTLELVMRRENRRKVYENLAQRAGLDLEPSACWLLYRLDDRRPARSRALRAPPCGLGLSGGRLEELGTRAWSPSSRWHRAPGSCSPPRA